MIKLNCFICGKEFEKQACWKNVTCCSKKCGYEKRKRNPRKPKNLVKKICVGCEKQFKEYPSNTQKFCTHKCYLKTRSKFVKYPNAQRLQVGKWLKRRTIIVQHFKGICQLCGVEDAKEVHHKIPHSITNDDSLNNLTLLCKACHFHLHKIMIEASYYNYYPVLDDTGENLLCLLQKAA